MAKGKNKLKRESRKACESAIEKTRYANSVNAGSKAFTPSTHVGEHEISLSYRVFDSANRTIEAGKRFVKYSNQTIKCNPDVKSGLRLRDLLIDKTGRIEKSKVSLRLMQARIGSNINELEQLVNSVRDCAHLVATGETYDNVTLYAPNASAQMLLDESRRAEVRGLSADFRADRVLLSKRTKKGTTKVLARRVTRLDTVRFDGVYNPVNGDLSEFVGNSLNFKEVDKRDMLLVERAIGAWQKRFDNRAKGTVSTSLQAIDNLRRANAALLELAFDALAQ